MNSWKLSKGQVFQFFEKVTLLGCNELIVPDKEDRSPPMFMQRQCNWIESRARGLSASGVGGDDIYGDEACIAWALFVPRKPMA